MPDISTEFLGMTFEAFLMSLNWLKLYDVELVLVGR